jgi:uncharacterized protein (DUF1684 family)
MKINQPMTLSNSKLICFFVFLISLTGWAQEGVSALDEIKKFQSELNKEYKDPRKSPLDPKARKKFKAHEFFPVDLKFRVTARLDRNVDGAIIKMKTSTDRMANYKKYGLATFTIDGKVYQLTLYQYMDLMKSAEYKDYLFLPFTDKTTGEQTYGAGRYIDMRVTNGDEIVIDFNQAYNPYCAYSDRYSCPKVPDENNLDVDILAGIKGSGKH